MFLVRSLQALKTALINPTYTQTRNKGRTGLYFYKNHIRAWVAWIRKVVEDFTAVPDGNMHAAELGEMFREQFLHYIACFCYRCLCNVDLGGAYLSSATRTFILFVWMVSIEEYENYVNRYGIYKHRTRQDEADR